MGGSFSLSSGWLEWMDRLFFLSLQASSGSRVEESFPALNSHPVFFFELSRGWTGFFFFSLFKLHWLARVDESFWFSGSRPVFLSLAWSSGARGGTLVVSFCRALVFGSRVGASFPAVVDDEEGRAGAKAISP